MLELRLREALRLARVLYREQVYLSMKATSPGLRPERLRKSVRQSGLQLVVLSFFIAFAILVTALGPLFVATSGEVGLSEGVRASGLLYAAAAFTITFMTCAWSSLTAQEYGLLEPLTHLPMRQEDLRLVALFSATFSALPVALVPPIYGLIVGLVLSSPLAGLAAALYGYTSMFFALALSLALAAALAKRFSGLSLRAKIARAIRTFLFVVCMGLFLFVSRVASAVMPLLTKLVGPAGALAELLWPVYPFSVAESMVLLSSGTLGPEGILSCCLAFAYLAGSYAAFCWAFALYWGRLMAPIVVAEGPVRPRELRAPGRLTMSPIMGILIKDMKMAYRDPRTAYLLVMPFFALLAYVLPLASGKLPPELAAPTVAALTGMIIIMLPSGACQLLMAEGRMFWALFASGIRKRELALAKALASSLAYAAYSVPLGLILAVATGQVSALAQIVTTLPVVLAASTAATCYLVRFVGPETRMLRITVGRGLMIVGIAALFVAPYLALSALFGPLGGLAVGFAELLVVLIALLGLREA